MMRLTLLRDASPAAMAFWYEVRNAKTVRQWCRCPKAITPEEHERWFTASLKNPRRRLYVATAYGRPVGIGRLDYRDAWTELSLAIHPLLQGRGYGREMVRQLTVATFRLGWPAPGAVVNGKNQASLNIFIQAGYVTAAKKWVQLTYNGGIA